MSQSTDITYFAKTNFRNQEAVFGIKTDDRRRHMYIIGKTGMGKTNLLEHLAIQDIRSGHGVAYVDPHGDTAEKLITMIPPERLNDVIYINPADQEFPIAFNVMEQVAPEYRHLVASGLVGVFKKLWAESWGPRLEYILRNALLALLECPDSTLLGVMRILVDKKYRAHVVNQVKDPVVKSFWVDEFTKWNDRVLQEVVAPIQNKVGQFLSTSIIRNIVGQPQSSFNIRDAMDQRKIIILNLAKGRIGEDNSALLGAMMITKIQMAAMARVDMPEEQREDFYLYVDEFQNFATESFANILSEARKYRLNLILANQYVTQIDEIVRDAIFGNAGTLIAFRVGAVDSEFLEKEFEPVFTMHDVVNLPKYNIYLKLMIDGIAGDAFSATTLPPIETEGMEDMSEKAIKISRERYAQGKVDVEGKINRWSGVFEDVPMRRISVGQERGNQQRDGGVSRMNDASSREQNRDIRTLNNDRQEDRHPGSMRRKIEPQEKNSAIENSEDTARSAEHTVYPAKCETCGLDIELPFKPDGKRPTFCKECLKEYQRGEAKKKQEDTPKHSQGGHIHTGISRGTSPSRSDVARRVVYGSQNTPMRLGQFQHIAPKKFKPLKKKASEVNLDDVRAIIQKAQSK